MPSVAALALVTMTACGASNESDAPSDSGSDTATQLTGTLNGAGASSQEKAQEAWRTGFQGANGGNVTVNYDPVGSGDGRKQFIAAGVSFAGSDSYLSDDEGELAAAKERCMGEDVIEVPAYVSPIAVIFNVEGVDSLNLSAKTIAQIFD
ncbi:MAG: phosphate ABC transporter substrate-binding protein PstS, partial [Myxococcales bacterium]